MPSPSTRSRLMVISSRSQDPFQRGFHFRGLEPERTGGALVRDQTVSVDHVESIRPRRVRTFNAVVGLVNEGRQLDAELRDTDASYLVPLVRGHRRGDQDVILEIVGDLPGVNRVSFLNVHDIEFDAIPVFAIEPIERGHRPAKRRSSVAAEDKDNRALAPKRREGHPFAAAVIVPR